MSTRLSPVAERGVLSNARLVVLSIRVNNLSASRRFYEEGLGLPLLDADPTSAFLDAGEIVVALKQASPSFSGEPRDEACDIVFLVDDIAAMRAALRERGVHVARQRVYGAGLVDDIYDPNGHRLMLYEPSAEALGWPSAVKMRTVWRSAGVGGSGLIGQPALEIEGAAPELAGRGLAGKPLVYLFVYVPRADEAVVFYEGVLGLTVLERTHCGNPACANDVKGVIKYDGGGVILSTHHLHQGHFTVNVNGQWRAPQELDPAYVRGVELGFQVVDLEATLDQLSRRGVTAVSESAIDTSVRSASFEAPSGHLFRLTEMTAAGMETPFGARTAEIIAAPL